MLQSFFIYRCRRLAPVHTPLRGFSRRISIATKENIEIEIVKQPIRIAAPLLIPCKRCDLFENVYSHVDEWIEVSLLWVYACACALHPVIWRRHLCTIATLCALDILLLFGNLYGSVVAAAAACFVFVVFCVFMIRQWPTGLCVLCRSNNLKKGDVIAVSNAKKRIRGENTTDKCIMHEDETFHVLFYIHNG